MDLMDYDRSFVRQRNDEMIREVRTQHLEKRLRAGGGTSKVRHGLVLLLTGAGVKDQSRGVSQCSHT